MIKDLTNLLLDRSKSVEDIKHIEAGALLHLCRGPEGAHIPNLLEKGLQRDPQLNFLEFFCPRLPTALPETRETAQQLSSQISPYVLLHAPLNGRQVFAVSSAVVNIGKWVQGHPEDRRFLENALTSVAHWPEYLVSASVLNLQKLAASSPSLQGGAILNSAAHACGVYAEEPPIRPVLGKEPSQADILRFSKAMNPAMDIVVPQLCGQVSDSTFLGLLKATSTCPSPANTLGGQFLQAFLQQMVSNDVSQEEKLRMFKELDRPIAQLSKVRAPLPSIVQSRLKSLDWKNGWKQDVQLLADNLNKPESPLRQIFTPKQRREVRRDYILLRDAEGKVHFTGMEKTLVSKQKLPTPDKPPKPLAVPIPHPERKDLMAFSMEGEGGELTGSLLRSRQIDPVGYTKSGDLVAHQTPGFKKRLVPKARQQSFLQALSHQLKVESVQVTSTELDI